MKKVLKRIAKWCLVVFVILVLLVLAAAVWYRESIPILFGNEGEDVPVAAVPAAPDVADLPPVTDGEADWLCWRGPDGDGRSLVTGIRTDWENGLKRVWEAGFLCQGKAEATWSAPVIRGNRVVVCGREKGRDLVFCLSTDDGKLLWQAGYAAKAEAEYGTGARATPWIDGDRVYTFGRAGDLACWALFDGKEVWRRDVDDEGGSAPRWGHSTSPLVTDALVIVGGGGSARTIAYDKNTGDVAWKSGNGAAGYAALVAMPLGETPAVLAFHATGLAALTPSDGRLLLDIPWKTSFNVHATTPVWAGDRVFITSGYGTGCQLLKVSPTGAEVLWTSKAIASHHSDPFIIGGHIYGFSGQSMQNRGVFRCVDLADGQEEWSTKALGWGTAVAVEDYLLCCDIKGNLALVKPDPEKYTEVTRMQAALGAATGATWTVPVVANGRLFLRFREKLVCYDLLGGKVQELTAPDAQPQTVEGDRDS